MSTLGVVVGPINVSVSGVAENYGERYKITYGASTTKITVVGSEADMDYYSDTTPWIQGGQPVNVVENNDNLSQIISGIRQEEKNIDERNKKGRSPLVKIYFGTLSAQS